MAFKYLIKDDCEVVSMQLGNEKTLSHVGNIEWYVPGVYGKLTVDIPCESDDLRGITAKLGFQPYHCNTDSLPHSVIFYHQRDIRDADFELKAGIHPLQFDVMLNDILFASCNVRASGKLVIPVKGEVRDKIKDAVIDQWIPDELTDVVFNLYESLGVMYHGEVHRMMHRRSLELFNLRVRNQEGIGEYYIGDFGMVKVYKPNCDTSHLPRFGYVNVANGMSEEIMFYNHGLLFSLDPTYSNTPQAEDIYPNQTVAIRNIFERMYEESKVEYIGDHVFIDGMHIATWDQQEQDVDNKLTFTLAGLDLPFFRLYYRKFTDHFKEAYTITIPVTE